MNCINLSRVLVGRSTRAAQVSSFRQRFVHCGRVGAATLLAGCLLLLAQSAAAVNINVTNYSWLQLPSNAVTPVVGSADTTTGNSFGTPSVYRWGNYVWLPSDGMTATGTQMYYAGVQLDQQRMIEKVKLEWYNAGHNVSGYHIDASNDGINWTLDIATNAPTAIPNNNDFTTTDDVTPGLYQYVRVRLEGSEYNIAGGYGGAGWTLIDPIGSGSVSSDKVNWANKATFNTTITSQNFPGVYDSQTYNNGTLENISNSSSWNGTQFSWPANAYTTIDLNGDRVIKDAIAVWAGEYTGNDFDVEYSLNGSAFTAVSGKSTANLGFNPQTGANGATEVTFTPVLADKIRMKNAVNQSGGYTLMNQLLLHGAVDGVLDSNPGANGTITLLSVNNQTTTLTGGVQLENDGLTGSAIGVLGYTLTGPNAGMFNVAGFVPGVLLSGQSTLYDLQLSSVVAGNYTAMLTFNTTVGDITFNLASALVPEPSSALLLGLGLVGFVGRLRRRRRSEG